MHVLDVDRIKEAANKYLVGIIECMTPASRVELFNELRSRYCVYCGIEQPKWGFCQCWNDE